MCVCVRARDHTSFCMRMCSISLSNTALPLFSYVSQMLDAIAANTLASFSVCPENANNEPSLLSSLHTKTHTHTHNER